MFGTEAEFKRTITAADGDSLADDDRYKDAIGELEDDRLAHFYVDTKALVDQALQAGPRGGAQQAEQFLQGFQLDKLGPIAGVVLGRRRPARDRQRSPPARAATTSRSSARWRGTGSTPLLGELPGRLVGRARRARSSGETARLLYQQFAGALGGAAIAGSSCASSSGSTSSRTSSAGSATSRSSCAGRRPTRSTAAR